MPLDSIDHPIFQAALEYARQGYAIFPARIYWNDEKQKWEKPPQIEGGYLAASSDANQIMDWYTAGYWDQSDAAIGFVPASAGMVVVDIDPRHDPDAELVAQLRDIPTRIVKTPSGGWHVYLRTSLAAGNGTFARGIDIRSAKGYVLLPPSPGYSVERKFALADAPDWVEGRLQSASAHQNESQEAQGWNDGDDTPAALARARQMLRHPDTEKEGGFVIACRLRRDCGLTGDKARELWTEWQAGIAWPWPDSEVDRNLLNAGQHGQNLPGRDAVSSAAETFPAYQSDTYQKAAVEPVQRRDGSAAGDTTEGQTGHSVAPVAVRELTLAEARARGAGEKPREFLWHDRLLRDEPNLWTGDAGIGKTTLAENVAVAVAAGCGLLGHRTTKAPVLLIVAEDRYKDVVGNIDQIAAARGCGSEIDIRVLSIDSEECDGRFWHIDDEGNVAEGPFWPSVDAAIKRLPRGSLVVFDPLAEFIHFDHNSDKAARACGRRLALICRRHELTIIVTDHPSKASMASGDHYGGSKEMKAAFPGFATLRLTEAKERGTDGQTALTFDVLKMRYARPSETNFYRVGDSPAYVMDAAPGQTPEEIKRRVLAMVVSRWNNEPRQTTSRDNRGVFGPRKLAFDLGMKERAVSGALGNLEADGMLIYIEGRGHTPASYAPGVHCPKEPEEKADEF